MGLSFLDGCRSQEFYIQDLLLYGGGGGVGWGGSGLEVRVQETTRTWTKLIESKLNWKNPPLFNKKDKDIG